MGVKRKRDCVKKVTASGAGRDKKVETATSENENKSPLVDQLPTAAETTPEVENGQQKKLKIDTSGELSSHEDAAAAAGESASTSQHETLEERSPSPQNENRNKQAPVTALKEIYLKTNKQVHVEVCFKLEELINSSNKNRFILD
jgi:hypothetical protein